MRKLKILDKLELAHTLISEGLVGKMHENNRKTQADFYLCVWRLVTIKRI